MTTTKITFQCGPGGFTYNPQFVLAFGGVNQPSLSSWAWPYLRGAGARAPQASHGPTNSRGPPTKQFISYFSLMIDAYETIRLSCRALLIIVLVRPYFYSALYCLVDLGALVACQHYLQSPEELQRAAKE